MKISQAFAEDFAKQWIDSWNSKDLEAILSHYAEHVVFSSPFVIKNHINDRGTILGKTELRNYFEKALERNPDLHFDLQHVMVGIKSVTLIYVRNGTLLACEAMILNDEGKVLEGLSHYPVDLM